MFSAFSDACSRFLVLSFAHTISSVVAAKHIFHFIEVQKRLPTTQEAAGHRNVVLFFDEYPSICSAIRIEKCSRSPRYLGLVMHHVLGVKIRDPKLDT